jgi:hypothetical protein
MPDTLRLAPALFLATGACFLLPITSLDADPSDTLTGLQLLSGVKAVAPDPSITIALISSVVGLFVSLFPGPKNLACSAFIAVPGALSLIFMSLSFPGTFHPAFYVLLFLFVTQALFGALSAWAALRPWNSLKPPSPLPQATLPSLPRKEDAAGD